MPPFWKVKRELRRIRDHGVAKIRPVFEVGQRARHDHDLFAKLNTTQGHLEPGRRLAVFVLFQPAGVAASSILTCQHLVANGYVPLVVSNAPLSQKDRDLLAPHAWRIVERPNFGYDFGAYRDAIWLIWRDRLDLDALILMNDSTWFPLRENDDALERIAGLDTDFAGLAYKQEPQRRTNAWYVESHFLHFRDRALRSDAFRKFWTDYRMSSDRERTINYGEKKITQTMIAAGFHPQGIMCQSTFLHWFGNLSASRQREVLAAGTYHTAGRRDQIDQLLDDFADTKSWQMRAFMQVGDMLAGLQFFTTTTFVAAGLIDFGQPFLKKSSDKANALLRQGPDRFQLARQKALELHDLGRIAPFHPIVERELRQAVESVRNHAAAPLGRAVPRPA